MSWSVVGHCPKCGAPIYVPGVWMGVNPPPNTYSCDCFTKTYKLEYGPSSTTADGQ